MGKYGASTNSTTKEPALCPRSPVMFSLNPGRPPTSGCKECIGYPDEPPESEIFGRMKRREGIELIMSQFGRKCKQWIAERLSGDQKARPYSIHPAASEPNTTVNTSHFG
jgi:hypothetical protein